MLQNCLVFRYLYFLLLVPAYIHFPPNQPYFLDITHRPHASSLYSYVMVVCLYLAVRAGAVWSLPALPAEFRWASHVERQSTCALEVDVHVSSITNVNSINVDSFLASMTDSFSREEKLVKSLAQIWDDERERRRDHGLPSQVHVWWLYMEACRPLCYVRLLYVCSQLHAGQLSPLGKLLYIRTSTFFYL